MASKNPTQSPSDETPLCESVFIGAELARNGDSTTRIVKYVHEFEGDYCYVECEEGATQSNSIHIANSYDENYDEWHIVGTRIIDDPSLVELKAQWERDAEIKVHDYYWHSQRYVAEHGIGELALKNKQQKEYELAQLTPPKKGNK